MNKYLKQYIEVELRDYHRSKKDLEELREEIIEGTGTADNMGIRSGISDITASKAIRLVTNKRLKKLEETVRAIDTVLAELDECKYKLVKERYWTRPKLLSDEGIAQEIGIDRATLYRWIDGITLAIADELGLIEKVSCR